MSQETAARATPCTGWTQAEHPASPAAALPGPRSPDLPLTGTGKCMRLWEMPVRGRNNPLPPAERFSSARPPARPPHRLPGRSRAGQEGCALKRCRHAMLPVKAGLARGPSVCSLQEGAMHGDTGGQTVCLLVSFPVRGTEVRAMALCFYLRFKRSV